MSSLGSAYVAVTNDLNQDQRMHRICNTLINMGYDVVLIGRYRKTSIALMHQLFKQKRLRLWFQSGIFFYLEYQIRLFIYLLFKGQIDLLYSVDLDTAMPIAAISKLKSVKSVHDAHELFTEVPELLSSPLKKSIWKRVGKLTMKCFNLRLTVNESLSKILEENYQCTFEVIRNLPIASGVKNSILQNSNMAPYIWYQGVLNKGRGLEAMISAMSSLPNLELRIAGEGDLSGELKKIASTTEVMHRIHFHGWLPPDELHQWASGALVGINLLEGQSGNYYYSLANRTFDYIQAELPAIHMDFPEYRRLNDQYSVAILIKNLESRTISDAISFLLENPKQHDIFKLNCAHAAKILTWDKESLTLINLIQGLH